MSIDEIRPVILTENCADQKTLPSDGPFPGSLCSATSIKKSDPPLPVKKPKKAIARLEQELGDILSGRQGRGGFSADWQKCGSPITITNAFYA